MKLLNYVTTLFFFSVLIGCKKDDNKNSIRGATAAEFKALYTDTFNKIIQKKTFKAEDGIVFVSTAGTTVTIKPGCLKLNGADVTGNVELQFAEIYDRGTMLVTNKATVGKKADGSLEQLNSGGEFLVEVYQGNNILSSSCSYTIAVPVNLTGGVNDEMTSFLGQIGEDDNLVWTQENMEFIINRQKENLEYQAWVNSFGWFNCDYFYNFPDPKTEIGVQIPSGYNNSNSNIYVARKGEPNTLAYLYGAMPVGHEIHLIFVTTKDGQYHYGVKSITVEAGHQVTFTTSDLTSGNAEQVTATINALP